MWILLLLCRGSRSEGRALCFVLGVCCCFVHCVHISCFSDHSGRDSPYLLQAGIVSVCSIIGQKTHFNAEPNRLSVLFFLHLSVAGGNGVVRLLVCSPISGNMTVTFLCTSGVTCSRYSSVWSINPKSKGGHENAWKMLIPRCFFTLTFMASFIFVTIRSHQVRVSLKKQCAEDRTMVCFVQALQMWLSFP